MVTRRRYLASAGAGLATLAGCVGSGSSGGLTLQSLAVAGSPGGPVPVAPAGQVALVDFFATWCAPCKPEMANLRAARARFAPDEVAMVSITTETDEAAIRDFWVEYEGTWPVASDPDLDATQRFGVQGVPTIVVVDASGEETWRHRGLAGEESIVAAIEDAL